ncbi:MAG: hypothetical protein JJ992_28785, partial [Planctomycetes bacterium]|nr:hypothetical protein [Planctomycetota bacterium]
MGDDNDRLIGSHYDDTIDGGLGDDTLTGNAGVDTFLDAGGSDTLVESQDADMSLFGDTLVVGKILADDGGDFFKADGLIDQQTTPPDPKFPAPVITSLRDTGDVYAAQYIETTSGLARDVQLESLLTADGDEIFEQASLTGGASNNLLVLNDRDNVITVAGVMRTVNDWTKPVTLDNTRNDNSLPTENEEASLNEYYLLNLKGTTGVHVTIRDTGGSIGYDEVYIVGTAGNDIFGLNATGGGVTGIVTAGDPNNAFHETVNFQGAERLQIHALDGDDALQTDDNTVETLIDLGAGRDEVTVGTVPLIPDPDNRTLDYPDGVPIADTSRMTNGVSAVTVILGQEGDDSFEVNHNVAKLFLHGGSDDDRFVVNTFLTLRDNPDDTNEITNLTTLFGGEGSNRYEHVQDAPVVINGGTGRDVTVIVGTAIEDTFVITENYVAGAGSITYYTDIEQIEIDAGGGDDVIWILGASDQLETTVRGGSGDDIFHLGGKHPTLIFDPPAFDYQPPAFEVQGAPFIDYQYTVDDPNPQSFFVTGEELRDRYGFQLVHVQRTLSGPRVSLASVPPEILQAEVARRVRNQWTNFTLQPYHDILTDAPAIDPPADTLVRAAQDDANQRNIGGLDNLVDRTIVLGSQASFSWYDLTAGVQIDYDIPAFERRIGSEQLPEPETVTPAPVKLDPTPLALQADAVFDVSTIRGRVTIIGDETFEDGRSDSSIIGDQLIIHNQDGTSTATALTSRVNVGATVASFQGLPGDPSTKSASFEIWFRPSDLDGQEVLFETGGNVDGVSFTLDDNTLLFTASSGTNSSTRQLRGTLSSAGDFVHAVGVIDVSGASIGSNTTPDMLLYVDGQLVAAHGDGPACHD